MPKKQTVIPPFNQGNITVRVSYKSVDSDRIIFCS